MEFVQVFAPATVANIGPGFDVLGMAVTGNGDTVEARQTASPGVVIEDIVGDGGRLPRDPAKNTAGIAAAETLKILGVEGGVSLVLHKNLPLGSGLGSSAASAAAAAWAVAVLHGFSDKIALLPAGLAAEAAVSGYHADNVAPALLGGLTLIYGYRPLRLEKLPAPDGLHLALVTPNFELPTAQVRQFMPQTVPLKSVVANTGRLGAMVAAAFKNDAALFGQAAFDDIVEPARVGFIPGFASVKQAALAAGAWACSISGAGPTVFALCDTPERSRSAGAAMQAAFSRAGLSSAVAVSHVDGAGARVV